MDAFRSNTPASAQQYLDTNVFPVLLPALEELLRYQQLHSSEPVCAHSILLSVIYLRFQINAIQWLAQYLKANNPNAPKVSNSQTRT